MQRSLPDAAAVPGSNRRLSVPHSLMALIAAALLLQGCASRPPAPSPAETAQAEAKAAYLGNNYQRTLAIVEPLAIGGEPWAQYTLGYMYYYGRGIAMDKQMAKLWIQRAAQQNYGPAQQALQRLARRKTPTANQEEMESPSAKPAAPPDQAASSSPSGTAPAAPPDTGSAAAGMPMSVPPSDTAKPAPTTENTHPSAAPQENSNAAPTPSAPDKTTPVAPVPPPSASAAPGTETVPPAAPPASSAKSAPAGHHANGIKGRDWIGSQDPQHYTVQLIAAGSEAAVVRFIHNHHLEGKAAYYAGTRNGKPWYTVIYGSYPDREAARQALRRLPAALSSASPWVRRFGDIQLMLEPTSPNDKK